MSDIEKLLKEELKRFNQINKYAKKMIVEQDVPEDPAAAPGAVPPAGDVPADAAAPDAPAGDVPADTPADAAAPEDAAAAPTDVPPADTDTEEVDITDLVNMTKSIKNDLEHKQSDNVDITNKMEDVFSKLDELESKLGEMNSIIDKIDSLNVKIDSIKQPTPVEKLEMRSLDSYPFNKNPQEFFNDKKSEMERTGKNYDIEPDDVKNYSKDVIMKTFNPNMDDENPNGF